MRKGSIVLILTSLILLTMASLEPFQVKTPAPTLQGTTDYPWAMFHHDTLRTGSSPTTAPASPSLMWTKVTGGTVYSSPAVSDGFVFIPSWDGNLYALDEYNGQVKWTFSTSGSIYASPAVSNGVVYVASWDGQIYAISEQNGVLVWRTNNVFNNPSNPIASSLLVADGKVFVGTFCFGGLCNPPGHFEALDANTGNILYINSTSAAVISSPSIDNGRVFFGGDDGTLLAVNETTGHRIWATGLSSPIRNAPAVANGRVYVGTFNRFYALSETTGVTSWSFNTNNANTTSAAVYQGIVYFGTGRGNVYALNATTGAQIWGPILGSGAINSSPALALGSRTLLVGSNDHNLYALNMTTGVRLWKYSSGGPISSSPAVADGRVFFGSQDSAVYALGPKVPQLHVTISSDRNSLFPGGVSSLTIAITDGTNPVSANLTLTSSLGGGLSPPVEQSPGLYKSNYTAPLVTSPSVTVVQVIATANGYLDGSSQTSITLEPSPPLTVSLTLNETNVAPGRDVFLLVRVLNGTAPVTGATLIFTPINGGTFSSVVDARNGNYSSVFSVGLLDSGSYTITVQAAKAGFSPSQPAQATIVVGGLLDLQKSKLFGFPILLLAVAALAIFLIIVGAFVARGRKTSEAGSGVPNYAVKRPCWLPGRLN